MNDGFNWHFPIEVALRLRIQEGKVAFDPTIVPDYNDYYDRIKQIKEKKFVELLQQFYDETPFRPFYKAHQPIYQECEQAMQKVVDTIDFGWYDSFFGPRGNSTSTSAWAYSSDPPTTPSTRCTKTVRRLSMP